MDGLETNADFITALALFPLKSIDKKVAFVLGLALLFKIPSDILFLFRIRSGEFDDWFTIFTQSVLCVTLLSHYGIVRALLNKEENLIGKLPKLPPSP